MPVLKPNEAMIERAATRGGRIGLLATFAPTLASMPGEFPHHLEIVPKLAVDALAALDRGDRAEHDRLVAEASRELRGCDLIALAQYSMAPAGDAGRRAVGPAGTHDTGERGAETEGVAKRLKAWCR
jgi:hypothetical protein